MDKKPTIAVSSCILGNRVRYDGELKHFPDICSRLEQHFELIAVCPEVEIGLGVPRPPLQLTGMADHPGMTGRDDPTIDVSPEMYAYCREKPSTLKHIAGFVFKSRSPSCGLRGIPLLNQGKIIKHNLRGLFAQAMVEACPELPVIEETELVSSQQQEHFIQQVLNYYKKTNPFING